VLGARWRDTGPADDRLPGPEEGPGPRSRDRDRRRTGYGDRAPSVPARAVTVRGGSAPGEALPRHALQHLRQGAAPSRPSARPSAAHEADTGEAETEEGEGGGVRDGNSIGRGKLPTYVILVVVDRLG